LNVSFVEDLLGRLARHTQALSRTAIALSFAIVFLGAVWAVTRFSLDWGEFLWTQRAFDEPFYFWNLARDGLTFDYRFWGGLLGLALLRLGASFDVMTEAYAFVVPSLCLASAWVLAGVWERDTTIKRLVWALGLLMAFDLLSGSDQAVFPEAPAAALARTFDMPRVLKPDLMNFFIFCRRPEQQSSFVVLFLYLSGLFGSFLTGRPRLYWAVCLATPLLVLVYVNVAIIAAMMFVMLSAVALVIYRRPVGRAFAFALIGLAVAVVAISLVPTTGTSATRGVFASHLPMLRPSIVFAVIGLGALAFEIRRHAYPFLARHWVALACFSIPLITLNQQVITGRAVLPQNWELSGNYVCILVGYAMLALRWKEVAAERFQTARQAGAVVLWLVLLAITVRGQLLNEESYRSPNDQSVAFAKVYQQAVAKIGAVDLVVLPHLWDESLFLTRVPHGTRVLGGYNWIIENWPAAWDTAEDFQQHSVQARTNFEVGFETLARRGMTPEQLRTSMASEIDKANCWPTMMYFFALQDCWPTFSNYTSPTLDRLKPTIEPLARLYESYLAAFHPAPDRKVLLIVPEPLKADASALLSNSLVASFETTHGDNVVRAYAYLQAAR
jgi:hypothetical protein